MFCIILHEPLIFIKTNIFIKLHQRTKHLAPDYFKIIFNLKIKYTFS